MGNSIRIGNLTLDLGSVGHAVYPTAATWGTYMRYAAYQSKFGNF